MRHAIAGLRPSRTAVPSRLFARPRRRSPRRRRRSTAPFETRRDLRCLASRSPSRRPTPALTRTAVTDETGSYVLQNLPVGPYRFEAALQGFRTYVQTGIVLEVGANPTLAVTLELGQLEETVSVQGSARAGRDAEPRHRAGDHQRAGARAAAQRAAADRADLSGGPGDGRHGHRRRAERVDAEHGVRSYPNTTIVVAGGLSNGMTYSLDGGTHNDPIQQPEPAAAVSRRDAGVQGRDERAAGAVRPSFGGCRQRRHEVGHERPAAAVRFEFMRDDSLNATNAFAALGPDGKRRERRAAPRPVRRHARRPHPAREAVLLRRLPGHAGQRDADRASSSSCRRPRCWPAISRRSRRRRATPAAPSRCARRSWTTRCRPALFSPAALNLAARLPKPDQRLRPGLLRSEDRELRAPGARPRRLPVEQQPLDLRPLPARAVPSRSPTTIRTTCWPTRTVRSTTPFTRSSSATPYLLGSNTVNSFRVTYNSADIRKDYVPFFDHGTSASGTSPIPSARLHGL